MTRTECPRFVRAVYKIWGLFLLSPDARQQRLNNYAIKDLLTIEDIGPGYLTQPIDIIASKIIDEQGRPNGMGLTTPKIDRKTYTEILGACVMQLTTIRSVHMDALVSSFMAGMKVDGGGDSLLLLTTVILYSRI